MVADRPGPDHPSATARAHVAHEVRVTPDLAALIRLRRVGVAHGRGAVVDGANAEALRIAGRPASDLAARRVPWRELVPTDAPERLVAAARTLLRDGGISTTVEVLRPDGLRVPVLLVAALVHGPEQAWLALIVDLTDEQWRGRLAEHEIAIVSTLLDDAPIGFALLDPQLRFVRVNREMAAMNGLTPEEHLGRPVFEVVPGVRASAEPLLRAVFETGVPLRDVEVTGTTDADPGVEHVWRESFFPVRAQPSAPVQGVAAVARDETRVRRLQAELAAASERQRTALEELQHALLPDDLPEVPGWRLGARCLSASDLVRLGGDCDVVPLGHRVVLTVGDVVGHGLTAVGTMAHARAAIRAFLSEGYGPGDVLERVSRLLHSPGVGAMATAVVACLDPATGEVEYASAGHPYGVLHTAGSGATLLTGAQGPMLGTVRGTYRTASAEIPPGGALVLLTDGLVERREQSLAVGFRRLVAAVETARRDAATAAEPSRLVDALLATFQPDPEHDDTCLLAAVRDAVDERGRGQQLTQTSVRPTHTTGLPATTW